MASVRSSRSRPRADTVAFVSLGCPKNLVDSEKMLSTLRDAGFELVSEHDGAGTIVINTCGFLEASRDESMEVIHEALERKRKGRVGRVVVAGCLVQRHRAKMLEWAPGIDALVGVFDRDRIAHAVRGEHAASTRSATLEPPHRFWISANALQAAAERGRSTVGLTVNGADGNGVGYFEDDSGRFRLTPRHWAYLRVSEGCNQRCAFCTIPSIRGKMRSKPIDAILREARELFQQGAVELDLIGQDTTSYGADIGYEPGLVGLLESLDREAASHGGAWLRLMYAYPSTFDDAMIDCFARLPNLLEYVDIPLQHASDRMLTAMRRQTSAAAQRSLIRRLRERVPGMAIRTTFITGFPGETEEDHRELLDFVRESRFDMMGVFRYSREQPTPAGTMDLDPALHVPDEVKAEREQELMLAQQQIAFEAAKSMAARRTRVDVLVDGP
ncbi:MAG: 30S ribosomal protein S12 methylthiotransferase RimO, partial [Phycisphaerae bacterium]|nr:30S ribosomal protein S12 methylthiotransferase RimO [Phycisphaerae bacterium]